jgi:hypothetical protein
LIGVGIRAVPVPGGCAIAIHVPRSSAPPHRVTANGSNRFYLRSSAGVYEVSMDELRTLFHQTAAVRDRVRDFRDQRLAALAADRAPIELAEANDRFVLHIVPLSSVGPAPAIDFAKLSNISGAFRPMGASGWNSAYNFYGHINYRGGEACHGYTQLFREGVVEAVSVGFVTGTEANPLIIGSHIVDMIAEYLPTYLKGLSVVGASPPIFVMASLIGVQGAKVVFDRRAMLYGEPQRLVDDLLLPICVIEDFGPDDAYIEALRPALDTIWNAGDRSRWEPNRA